MAPNTVSQYVEITISTYVHGRTLSEIAFTPLLISFLLWHQMCEKHVLGPRRAMKAIRSYLCEVFIRLPHQNQVRHLSL